MQTIESKYPQELIDEIVDNVAAMGGVQSLKICSLISSAFQHRAQSHLYRTLRFEGTSRDAVCPIDSIVNLDLAFAANPKLASYTRILRLQLGYFGNTWAYSPQFLAIVKQLDNLEEVFIGHRTTHPFKEQGEWLNSFWKPFIQPRVRKLSTQRVWDFPLHFVTGCPKLKELNLYSMRFNESTPEDTPKPPSLSPAKPPSLTHLRVRTFSYASMDNWKRSKLIDFIDFTNLSSIEYAFHRASHESQSAWLSTILDSARTSLRSLTLGGRIVNPYEARLSLSQLVSLHAIVFCIQDYEPASISGDYDPILAISDILATIRDESALISLEIVMQLHIEPLTSLRWLACRETWARLDDAINGWQERAKTLVHLTISIEYPQNTTHPVDVATLLQEYELIRGEKLPLTKNNKFIEMRVFTR